MDKSLTVTLHVEKQITKFYYTCKKVFTTDEKSYRQIDLSKTTDALNFILQE